MRRPTRHVILSPHLDDAVLSCGGSIARLTGSAQEVVVLTLFSGAVAPPFSPFAATLHARWGDPPDAVRLRRAEDAAAVARLGACAAFEDVPDAIYRRSRDGDWLYATEEDLSVAPLADDDWIAPYLVERVRLMAGADSTIYGPLGIGHHPDHVLAFQVSLSLCRQGYSVVFYEDFPYASVDAAYRQRTELLSDWHSFVDPIEPQDLTAKIEASGYYRSQLAVLFNDAPSMVARITGWAEQVGGGDSTHGERFWRPPD